MTAVSPKPALRPSRIAGWIAAFAAAVALAACETPGRPDPRPTPASSGPISGSAPDPATVGVAVSDDPAGTASRPGAGQLGPIPTGAEFTPPHLSRSGELTRVAVLLPFSGPSDQVRREAANLLRAAELALFERGDETVVLLPKDTAGTAEGGRSAARAAIQDGARLIIGPLLAPAVEAAGDEARAAGVPVIGFSTDPSVAGDGVYLLSFPPSEEIRRVVEHAASRGASRFAFIGPSTPYGQAASDAYRRAVAEQGGSVAASEFYSGGVGEMGEASRRLARMGIERLDGRTASRMTGADWAPSDSSAFQVVLMPDGGDDLRMLAPSMLFADIDPLVVKFMGTGLWRNPQTAREPGLEYGWFAGPDPRARGRFEQAYRDAYGEGPSNIAGLAYDAASLAIMMARSPEASIESDTGFMGVDGLFRFRADGTVERGLAVYQVRGGGFEAIDPAPDRFGAPDDRFDDRFFDEDADDEDADVFEPGPAL